MHTLLTIQGLANVLDSKNKLSKTMKEADKVELIEKAKNIILLNLLNEVLIKLAKEKGSQRCGQNLRHFI